MRAVLELASWAPTELSCWHINYSETDSVVDGVIFHDNKHAGHIKLALAGSKLEIVNVYLFEQYQRRGFLRDYISALVNAAPEGIESVLVYASGDGAGVWHKFGFEPVNTYSAHELSTSISSLGLDVPGLHNQLFVSENPVKTLLSRLEDEQELALVAFFLWHGRLRLNSSN